MAMFSLGNLLRFLLTVGLCLLQTPTALAFVVPSSQSVGKAASSHHDHNSSPSSLNLFGKKTVPEKSVTNAKAIKKAPIQKTTNKKLAQGRYTNKPKSTNFERQKQEWNLSLALLYMTPWKNPNSIFVYLFGILYVLGKISEARGQ